MAEIRDLDVAPDPTGNPRFPEQQPGSTLNNGARDLEGIIAREYRDIRGDIVDTGSVNAYFLTANRSFAGGYDGLEMVFRASTTNTGDSTLAIAGGVGATQILSRTGEPLQGGEIQAGAKIHVIHEAVPGGKWRLMSAGVEEIRRIDVKNLGAKGDGTTNDDQAFTDAEAARAAKGWQRVHVPDGTYLLTTAPDWDRITGEGIISYNGDLIPAGDVRFTSRTLNVPGTFPTLDDAWNYLETRRIFGKITATIQFADGTYTFANQFLLNHPNGEKIRLLGNTTTPANCILRFTHAGAQDGFVVSRGYTLGLFDGFTVDMAAKAVWPNNGSGLLADRNATFLLGQNMIVNNIYYSAQARLGSFMDCNSFQSDNAGDVGIFAYMGGVINAQNAVANNATDPTNGWGTGIAAEGGGIILIPLASATGNALKQIDAVNDGVLWDAGQGSTGREPYASRHREQFVMRGGDPVIDLRLTPKGGGSNIQLDGAPVFTTGLSIIGYFEMKDNSGTPRRFALLST